MDSILIENIHGLTIKDEMRLEHIVAQIQPLLRKEIVCVKNGESLVIYRDRKDFPIGLKLEKVVDNIYYMRSVVDDDIYAVAGKEIAGIFFPNLSKGNVRYASINNMGVVSSEISMLNNPAKIKKITLE